MARTPRAASAASAHCLSARPDALALADEPIDKRLLPRGGLGLAGARRKHAGGDPRVHGDERVAVEDAHQVRVPLHAEPLAEQARAARDRTRRPLRRGHRCGPSARRAVKNGKASAARGCSAGCSTSTKCVQTWRRVVP